MKMPKLNLRKGFGLFRNFGWKKNLLAVAAGFLLAMGLEQLRFLLEEVRVLSTFDPTLASIPFIGFIMGIWGILGSLAYIGISLLSLLDGFKELGMDFSVQYVIVAVVSTLVYSVLPSLLWYLIPIKNEKFTTYPRLDTAAHVFKFYIIMVVTVIVYMFLSWLLNGFNMDVSARILDYAVIFTQYLSTVLIIGIPVIIVLAHIHYRTLTINERMVLAFLAVVVAAVLIGSWLIYRISYYVNSDLFTEYDRLLDESIESTENGIEILIRYQNYWNWFYVMVAILFNSLLIIAMFLMRSIEKKVTKPILRLADAMERYAGQAGEGLKPEALKEECAPYRSGYGEVSSLTRTCVDMAGEVEAYMKNLQTATAEKERIGTELNVASAIQNDMLPRVFPPFPNRKEIDLYASMTPAREVGGDFYDFYLIDRDHLALTIADVSGKGVPAALFMVITKTLLQNHAQLGGSPKEILSYVNHQLATNNDALMFCTVWLGILDLNSGRLISANAGHEYPAIRRGGGEFVLQVERHDPPLGLRDGLRFKESEAVLQPGDSLFIYTDGVTEGTDASLEEFGEERLVLTLNRNPEQDAKETIENLYGAIREFAGDTPQFDDITMLCLKYLGPQKKENESLRQACLTVRADTEELDRVTAFTEEELEAVGCPEDVLYTMTLAAEEIFVNVANYAYEGREGSVDISLSCDADKHLIEMAFSDRGTPFDPTARKAPDITAKPGQRPIGGLGIHLVKKTMDEVTYRYEGGKNVLTIRKSMLSAAFPDED